MYNSMCTRCRAARAGGYPACNIHRVSTPTVVVERHRAPTVVVVDDFDTPDVVIVEDYDGADVVLDFSDGGGDW